MAFTTTMLAWSVIEFGSSMHDQLSNAKAAIRWSTDYLLKATATPGTIYVQVSWKIKCFDHSLFHWYWYIICALKWIENHTFWWEKLQLNDISFRVCTYPNYCLVHLIKNPINSSNIKLPLTQKKMSFSVVTCLCYELLKMMIITFQLDKTFSLGRITW